jgi:molybdopterin biosynthesis enzyme MoaB
MTMAHISERFLRLGFFETTAMMSKATAQLSGQSMVVNISEKRLYICYKSATKIAGKSLTGNDAKKIVSSRRKAARFLFCFD